MLLLLHFGLIHKYHNYDEVADSSALPGYIVWTLVVNSLEAVCSFPFYDQLLPSIYPWLRNRCLAINNSSLLVSADMSHVPVALQRPGWTIHISSDISALWTECHISPCLYSSLYLYNQVKEGKIVMPEHTYIHIYIHFYIYR
jgi:hypothetical protein